MTNFGERLAELLSANRRREREDAHRPQLRYGAHRDPVRALRLPSGPCVRRWPAADGEPANPVFTPALVETVKRLGLKVETVVGLHGRPVPWSVG